WRPAAPRLPSPPMSDERPSTNDSSPASKGNTAVPPPYSQPSRQVLVQPRLVVRGARRNVSINEVAAGRQAPSLPQRTLRKLKTLKELKKVAEVVASFL